MIPDPRSIPSEELPTEPAAFTVSADEARERLDRYLAGKIAGLSRARAQALIRGGCASVAGRRVTDANHRLNEGDGVLVIVPPREPSKAVAETIPLEIVYEDGHLLVIDKPAGLVVHPAPGHRSGTLVNALLAHCGEDLSGTGGLNRPGIVHRLDKDTSGLLVVAKTEAAHGGLSAQFAAHGADGRLERAYLALCWGAPAKSRGVVDARIGRSPANRQKMAVRAAPAGRHAVTRFRVRQCFAGVSGETAASLLWLELATGRTHQIRVHMAHIGHPLLGDPAYGAGFKTRARVLPSAAREALERLGHQALHAAELGFEHPVSGERLRFSSPPPEDLARLIEALGRGHETPGATDFKRRGR